MPAFLSSLFTLLLLASALCTPSTAQDAATASNRTITLGNNVATINLPAGYRFIPENEAKKLLQAQGMKATHVVGLILPPKGSNDHYNVLLEFNDVGYVNDDDAGKLNADEILNNYKDGNKEQNEKRKELNLPPFYVGNWAEKPHYDKATHHVIWALEVKDEDSATAPVSDINYQTRILGRRGVLSMNLVTALKSLDADKIHVSQLLDDTTFNKGESYAEYVPGKDKSAGYGIAGLILGGGAMAAAAKFGFFGFLWKYILVAVLALKKFIILIVVAAAGGLSKLFGKKKKSADGGGPQSGDPPVGQG